VDKYIGSFHRRVETDLNFPALSCDHSFAAKIIYEEKLPERGEVRRQGCLWGRCHCVERREAHCV